MVKSCVKGKEGLQIIWLLKKQVFLFLLDSNEGIRIQKNNNLNFILQLSALSDQQKANVEVGWFFFNYEFYTLESHIRSKYFSFAETNHVSFICLNVFVTVIKSKDLKVRTVCSIFC